jgi:predicted small secreted protein
MMPWCLIILLALGGCSETTYGLGQDMQHAGANISNWAKPGPASQLSDATISPADPYAPSPDRRDPNTQWDHDPNWNQGTDRTRVC